MYVKDGVTKLCVTKMVQTARGGGGEEEMRPGCGENYQATSGSSRW